MAKKLSNQFQGTCVMFVEDKLITFLQMFRNSLKFNSSFVASELAFVSTIHWRWSVVMVISSTCFGKKDSSQQGYKMQLEIGSGTE